MLFQHGMYIEYNIVCCRFSAHLACPLIGVQYATSIKTFSNEKVGGISTGIKGHGGVKSKGTRLLIEKEK